MNFIMPSSLKEYYCLEIFRYKKFLQSGDFRNAWNSLERSHILGQAYPLEHTRSHWLMLKFGFKIRRLKEIFGQIPRLLIGGVKSFVGIIPVGNTGGSNVSPLKPMEIPSNLKSILDNHKSKPYV
ncbi:Protein of unknown function [Christiangramia echinicola]|uniref:DUF3703 domain-containing protein n=2 Tax=Christiangramia echinicola TaxID=279359 RepID=A0A1H1LMS4_9FLAO|nr:DUF3703 domain-containing protein [Christiangramia echinicola]SDR75697.1 Protein of unknown function [Christiangramia echinicola]